MPDPQGQLLAHLVRTTVRRISPGYISEHRSFSWCEAREEQEAAAFVGLIPQEFEEHNSAL